MSSMQDIAATRVHYFADSARFARRLARDAGFEASCLEVHRFPDGESLVRVSGAAGSRAVLVRSLDDPNAKLIEVLLAADALRRAGAGDVTLVAPYLPYMRQDTVFSPGQPNSQAVIGGLLGASFDAVITVEAHLHRVSELSEVAGVTAQSISAAPAIAEWVREHAPGALIVGPDVESTSWARAIAAAAGLPYAVGEKRRLGDLQVEVDFVDLPAAAHAVLVDDIASSGVTLAAAAAALRRGGIQTVRALVVHAIFAPGALRRIRDADILQVLSSDTITHASNGFSTAGLVATALSERERAHRVGNSPIGFADPARD